MWIRDDKCGSLKVNTGDSAYMGEPLIIVTALSALDVGRGPGSVPQTSSVLTIKGKMKFMFLPKLNSECVFKYPLTGFKNYRWQDILKEKKSHVFLLA